MKNLSLKIDELFTKKKKWMILSLSSHHKKNEFIPKTVQIAQNGKKDQNNLQDHLFPKIQIEASKSVDKNKEEFLNPLTDKDPKREKDQDRDKSKDNSKGRYKCRKKKKNKDKSKFRSKDKSKRKSIQK